MEISVFTDGSCIRKKGKECYGGYGVYFPNGEFENAGRPFTHGPITNQRAELYAIYKALKTVTSVDKFQYIKIYTDSDYSIKSLDVWIHNWVKNGWKTANNKPVKNKDILEKLYKYMIKYKSRINFIHVKAHTGFDDELSRGNDMADRLANQGSDEHKRMLNK